MKHTLLASLAAVILGTTAFLGTAPAHASHTSELDHEVSAVMGPEQEYQRGLAVNGVAPTLRSVTVDEETILAYCIEYWVRAAAPGHQAAVTTWDGFTGDNRFKTNPQVRQAVAWILHNSYPALSIDELAARTAATNLTAAEAIAATQAAIWFYTDDFVSDGVLTVEAAPDDAASLTATSAANVHQIFAYLTGDQNTGLTEHEVQASVTLHDASGSEVSAPGPVLEAKTDDGDHLLGPVTVKSSSDHVSLRLDTTNLAVSPEELTLLDAQGQAIDTTKPIGVQELWVLVPADTASGGVQLSAESTEYGYTGRLIIPEPAADRRFQTIVVVDQISNIATTELALHWEKAELAEPPVEEPREEEVADHATEETLSDEEITSVAQTVTANPTQEQQTNQELSTTVTLQNPPGTPAPTQAEVDTIETEETVQAQHTATEELAETGAHQTRNILVALGTIAVGGVLIIVNRLRRKWA